MHVAQAAVSKGGLGQAATEQGKGSHSNHTFSANDGTHARAPSGHSPGSLRAAVCGQSNPHLASDDLDLDLSGGITSPYYS